MNILTLKNKKEHLIAAEKAAGITPKQGMQMKAITIPHQLLSSK